MICASGICLMRGAYQYAPPISISEAHTDMRLAYSDYQRRIQGAPRIAQ